MDGSGPSVVITDDKIQTGPREMAVGKAVQLLSSLGWRPGTSWAAKLQQAWEGSRKAEGGKGAAWTATRDPCRTFFCLPSPLFLPLVFLLSSFFPTPSPFLPAWLLFCFFFFSLLPASVCQPHAFSSASFLLRPSCPHPPSPPTAGLFPFSLRWVALIYLHPRFSPPLPFHSFGVTCSSQCPLGVFYTQDVS